MLAGCLILHQVSVQSAAGASQAATEAAEPPEEPQGILFFPQGFTAFLKAEVSFVDHIANSSIVTFQRLENQASFSFFITNASKGGLKFSSIFEEQVVGTQISQKISFTAIGAQAKTEVSSASLFNHKVFTKLKD
jgi:hypothetical protein